MMKPFTPKIIFKTQLIWTLSINISTLVLVEALKRTSAAHINCIVSLSPPIIIANGWKFKESIHENIYREFIYNSHQCSCHSL